jgi:hypothetical protein
MLICALPSRLFASRPGESQLFPLLVPQVYVVALVSLLVRYHFGENNGINRAYLKAGFFAVGAAFFAQVRRVGAEVAFLGMFFLGIPDGPAGRIGTGIDAFLAADTFFYINCRYIAGKQIPVQGSGWTNFEAGSIHALPALGYSQVIRPFFKRVLQYLDS